MSVTTKRHTGSLDQAYSLLLTCLYGIFHMFKAGAYAREGRFWAEEGYFFFEDISQLSPLDGLGYLFNGHLELFTNFVVLLATLAPLDYAPLLTTHLSALLQAAPIVMIIFHRQELGLGKGTLLCLLITAVGLPQAAEVWANSINLHFHFAILASLIAALDIPSSTFKAHLFRVMLLACGLSGVPANFLLPVFFYRALIDKRLERFIQFGILAATTALQIYLLMSHRVDAQAGSRHFDFSLTVFWFATLTQSLIAPLAGVFVGDQMATIWRDPHFFNFPKIFFPLLCTLPLIALISDAFKATASTKKVLVLSAVILTALSVLTALGIKDDLISPRAAGRYFYAPTILWALLFFAYFRWNNGYTVMLAIALTWSSLRNLADDEPQGPAWHTSLTEARSTGADTIPIWPTGWEMQSPENTSGRTSRARRPRQVAK